jgi:hypothetical protein
MEEERDEIAIGLADRTELMMINKKERMPSESSFGYLKSATAKEWISKNST